MRLPDLFALVPCAGQGSRSGAPLPKQYVAVAGAPLVAHTLSALDAVARLRATLVVLSPDDDRFEALVPQHVGPRRWTARCGGATRAATVDAGLEELRRRGAGSDDWVLVHDAARCLLRPAWVDRLIDACLDDPVGGLLALPLADTLKQGHSESQRAGRVSASIAAQARAAATEDLAARADAGTAARAAQGPRVAATVDRQGKWAAQTPQMFRLGTLAAALRTAGSAVTDESSAVEACGLAPRLVPGALENLKVTWPEDFDLAARLLATVPAPGVTVR
jgi:2-C-methyl-D-erythritol 4-phosphate cytidylyltransferase